MRHFLSFILAAALGTSVAAQDRPNTILVMDGSGSMWGQIDGVAKITIAQDVVRDLLTDLPPTESLGLTVYGHRARGDCTDIENVVAAGPNTRDAIAAAVDGISPLGKTPMTDAVIAAAEALRYTEDSATVILVSDGVETCNPDPCAAAALLEQAGIDFTAHVIGFDVSGDAEALAQMQCIADETGGMFIPASDAGELSEALNTVVEDPEPIVVTGTFRAIIGDGGPLIEEPILWDVASDSGTVVDDEFGNPLTANLLEGTYRATAYRLIDEVQRDVAFTVTGPGDVTVDVVFPEIVATATLDAPETAPVGSTIQVGWDGPGEADDWVGIGMVDSSEPWKNFFYTRDGNPGDLLMPTEPGDYLIQYFQVVGRPSIASVPITLTPVTATIDAPAEAVVGDTITVSWTGPDYAEDFIGIGMVDATGASQWASYFYTKAGPSGELTMPSEPGDYVIQYFFGQGQKPLMGVPITLVAVGAGIDAPAEAVAGSTISVTWSGPDYPDDYIGVGAVGASGAAAWENYVYTREGNTIDLLVPIEPGDYLIQYFIGQDRTTLATVPLTVTPVGASITAPASASAGSDIAVTWTGPDYADDYIGIGAVGAEGASQWQNYVYTREGSDIMLTVPPEPGDYVIRYFAGQDREVLASVPFTATEVGATIDAPATAIGGSTIRVNWTGPDYPDDYIGVGKVGANGGNQWENYVYTREGNAIDLLVPVAPGDYLIRYFIGQDRAILQEVALTVTEATATITAPATAVAGSTITVDWTGPDYADDYVGVGAVDASGGNQWQNYVYTREGSPMSLLMPVVPGDYLIRYFTGQDRVVLKSHPITLTDFSVTLLAEPRAAAESTLVVGWDGPDYKDDYIGIGKVGATGGSQWQAYAYTRDGNPAQITLPAEPGDYLVTYFTGQDRVPVKQVPLTIE